MIVPLILVALALQPSPEGRLAPPAPLAPPVPLAPAPQRQVQLLTPAQIAAPPPVALARQIAGSIYRTDLPASLAGTDFRPPLVRITITPDGGAADCAAIISTGNAEADAAVCRAVTERFRFDSARAADGKATYETRLLRPRWARPVLPGVPAPIAVRAPVGRPGVVGEATRTHPPAEGPRAARLRSGRLGSDDYPAASIRAEEQGTVRAGFVVGTSGLVESCSVVRSSGFTRLDNATCMLLILRLRYDPAHDARGNPVEEVVQRTITWSLPNEHALPPAEPAGG